jgi:hypothetical protein
MQDLLFEDEFNISHNLKILPKKLTSSPAGAPTIQLLQQHNSIFSATMTHSKTYHQESIL